MSDNLSPQDRSKNMSAIRSARTKIEEKVCNELWRRGYRFRRNVISLYGKPDIAIKKYKLVIFIDSCFWHGCEEHGNIPKSNTNYWEEKLNRNKIRDKEVTNYYTARGWSILRLWEHQLKSSFDDAISQLSLFIDQAKSKSRG